MGGKASRGRTERAQRANPEKEVISTANNQNLRPFNTLPPEERREIARKGGIASGKRRRYLAELRLSMMESLAGYDLAVETREEYRRAIKRLMKEERAKARRGKQT